jgi:hypothetical protein
LLFSQNQLGPKDTPKGLYTSTTIHTLHLQSNILDSLEMAFSFPSLACLYLQDNPIFYNGSYTSVDRSLFSPHMSLRTLSISFPFDSIRSNPTFIDPLIKDIKESFPVLEHLICRDSSSSDEDISEILGRIARELPQLSFLNGSELTAEWRRSLKSHKSVASQPEIKTQWISPVYLYNRIPLPDEQLSDIVSTIKDQDLSSDLFTSLPPLVPSMTILQLKRLIQKNYSSIATNKAFSISQSIVHFIPIDRATISPEQFISIPLKYLTKQISEWVDTKDPSQSILIIISVAKQDPTTLSSC